jgi:hypothetical protein
MSRRTSVCHPTKRRAESSRDRTLCIRSHSLHSRCKLGGRTHDGVMRSDLGSPARWMEQRALQPWMEGSLASKPHCAARAATGAC